jgi:hypothetical protein
MRHKRVDEQLVCMLNPLLPCRVERCGVLEPRGLLRCGSGGTFDDRPWVKDCLKGLRDPTKRGVALVIKTERAEGHRKVGNQFMYEGLPWCWGFCLHLLCIIEGHPKLYTLVIRGMSTA